LRYTPSASGHPSKSAQVVIAKQLLPDSEARCATLFEKCGLGGSMASRRPAKTTKPLLTMHDWEAKHYVLAAVIILVVMGMFAYSWS
jgi:hypothetical protein